MTKVIILVSSLLFLSACTLFPSASTPTRTPSPSPVSSNTSITPPITGKTTQGPTSTQYAYAAINTKNGQLVLKLYRASAPKTVANFLNKVNSGFYNGLIFHRVVPGFVVQGGDPTGTGNGGGTIASELNKIPFKRGSVGLARTPDSKNVSNASQFFICLTDTGCSGLTGDYVNFGEVISGFDVLDKIAQGDKMVSVTTQTK